MMFSLQAGEYENVELTELVAGVGRKGFDVGEIGFIATTVAQNG